MHKFCSDNSAAKYNSSALQHRNCESVKLNLQSWKLFCRYQFESFTLWFLLDNECGWQSSRMDNHWFEYITDNHFLLWKLRSARIPGSLYIDGNRPYQWMCDYMQC